VNIDERLVDRTFTQDSNNAVNTTLELYNARTEACQHQMLSMLMLDCTWSWSDALIDFIVDRLLGDPH
jgi:hypothetical protein